MELEEGLHMRLIRAVIAAMAGSLCVQAASACNMSVTSRSAAAAGYVENAQRCLGTLPEGFTFDESMEADNLRRVNAERARDGKSQLKFRPELLAAARWHSMDMAANNFFSHKSKDQRTHDKRVSLLDRSLIYDASRENIAMIRGAFTLGTEDDTLHEGLMESPGHKSNILADNISHAAMGVVRYKNGVWLTQVFVNEAGELSAPAPVRLYPGQVLGISATLKDWEFKGFNAEQGETVTPFKTNRSGTTASAPGGVFGDVVLSTRGERRNKSGGGSYINLSGPEVTMVASRAEAAATGYTKPSAATLRPPVIASRSSTAYGQPYTPPAGPSDYPIDPKAAGKVPSQLPSDVPLSGPKVATAPRVTTTRVRPVQRRVTRRTISPATPS